MKCAICKDQEVPSNPYDPNLVCPSCEGTAVDGEGNPVTFYNESISGGIIAHHSQKDGIGFYDDDLSCFVRGIECHGVEFKFGGTGIVIGKEAT